MQVQLGLLQLRAFLLRFGQRSLRSRACCRHLLRTCAGILYGGLGLLDTPLYLGDLLFGAGDRGARGIHGGGAGLGCGVSLFIGLARHFILRNEIAIPREIGLRARVIRFRFLQTRRAASAWRCADVTAARVPASPASLEETWLAVEIDCTGTLN